MNADNRLTKEKASIRRRQIQLRESLDPGQTRDWSRQMVDCLLKSDPLALLIDQAAGCKASQASCPLGIGLYVAMRQEADFEAAWSDLEQNGLVIALPRMIQRDGLATLEFRAAPSGNGLRNHLKPAGFGVLEPDGKSMVVEPALIILPGLAFDRSGNRLGWGKGYYDHYLAQRLSDPSVKPPVLVGAAYPNQILASVPAGPADIPVDYLLTPSGIMKTSRNQ